MKNILYTFVLLTFITSCRSLEKMIEKGDYDSAIVFAAEKLAGKKNKKTKHVAGLEEAFQKITQRDLDRIAYLDGKRNPEKWEEVEAIADKMAWRQGKIEPLLPLISKEGYVGYFEFADSYAIKKNAQEGSAEYYYTDGSKLLELARMNTDKRQARLAYESFKRADNKLRDYKNTYVLMQEAKELGRSHILVDVINKSQAFVPGGLQSELETIDASSLDTKWRRFYVSEVPGIKIDHRALLELTDIDLSPEREIITYHTDEKKIKDGFRYLKDKKGKVKTDSTGKKLKEDKFKTVYADVSEIHREKAAMIRGLLKVYNYKTGALVTSRPLSVEALFSDYASSYRGDRRAICDTDHSRLKTNPRPFPHDLDMIADATHRLKGKFVKELSEVRI